MCLDMLYELPPPRWGVGYKVVQKTKQTRKYLCLYFPVAIYRNRWVTDPAPPDILQTPCPADIPQYYPKGFHVLRGKQAFPEIFNMLKVDRRLACVMVKFREPVAFGVENFCGKNEVVVAREIMVLKEIKPKELREVKHDLV
jgi:hypothetical protein